VATLGRIPRAAAVFPLRAVRLSHHGRRRLVVLGLLLVALAAGYMFWLRDSSLVQVQNVTVSGVDTADGARVRAKLTAVARHMTTLHVDAAALRRAVADEPIVQSLSVQPDFPHGLRISIVQNRPVAFLVAGGRQVAVAPDGTLLDASKVDEGLPTVRVGVLPSAGRMPAGPARDRVAVAATAPTRLLPRIASISIEHGRGAVAQLQNGPVVIFGQAVALDRKWLAATAVLADRKSQGATYIDVRMPERPVAGGLSLSQDPQPQAEAPPQGSPAGTVGVLPAIPDASAAVAGQAQQTDQQAPVTPATTTPPAGVGPTETPTTQAQP
jgi:cell division protein FtsQ